LVIDARSADQLAPARRGAFVATVDLIQGAALASIARGESLHGRGEVAPGAFERQRNGGPVCIGPQFGLIDRGSRAQQLSRERHCRTPLLHRADENDERLFLPAFRGTRENDAHDAYSVAKSACPDQRNTYRAGGTGYLQRRAAEINRETRRFIFAWMWRNSRATHSIGINGSDRRVFVHLRAQGRIRTRRSIDQEAVAPQRHESRECEMGRFNRRTTKDRARERASAEVRNRTERQKKRRVIVIRTKSDFIGVRYC
jgi:hypothetical protein